MFTHENKNSIRRSIHMQCLPATYRVIMEKWQRGRNGKTKNPVKLCYGDCCFVHTNQIDVLLRSAEETKSNNLWD